METRDLNVFITVAKVSSISIAARKLHYVQSNVSARIKVLEEELGTKLFLRNKYGVTLTPAGKELKTYAEKILQLNNLAKKSVQRFSETASNLITIGAVDSFSSRYMPEIIKQHYNTRPDVDFTVMVNNTDELINQVTTCSIDGAIVYNAPNHIDIEHEEIQKDELVVISLNPINDLSELSNKILIKSESCTFYDKRIEQWAIEKNLVPKKTIQLKSISTIIACIENGVGYAILPKSLIKPSNNLHVTSLPDSINKLSIYFISHQNSIVKQELLNIKSLAKAVVVE